MKAWLVEHGYLKSGMQKTREELEKLMHEKLDFLFFHARVTKLLTVGP